MKKILTYIWLVPLLIISGCERKKHTPPPVERVALTTDFFQKMEDGDSEAAVYSGKTILQRDGKQNHVRILVSFQESNEAVARAQEHLDRGDVDAAYNIIDRALKKHPENEELKFTARKLEQLKHAGTYFRAMEEADSAASVSETAENIRSGLSLNMTDELTAYLARHGVRENDLIRKEQQNTINVLEEASEAAERAKKEDAAREAENLRFIEERDNMSAEGRKMRDEAPLIPSDSNEDQSSKK